MARIERLLDRLALLCERRAAQQADERLAAGDIEGRAVWLRILEAVNELMATKRPEGVVFEASAAPLPTARRNGVDQPDEGEEAQAAQQEQADELADQGEKPKAELN